jgi:hypothetical protein
VFEVEIVGVCDISPDEINFPNTAPRALLAELASSLVLLSKVKYVE